MEEGKSTKRRIQVKTYSVKEVAELYGISGKTLKKWLYPFEKEIGERRGYFYNPKQVGIIFEKLGLPGIIYLN
jgi:transposase